MGQLGNLQSSFKGKVCHCDQKAKVGAAERSLFQFLLLPPDGSTFLQLKMAGVGTPGVKCELQKHHDV